MKVSRLSRDRELEIRLLLQSNDPAHVRFGLKAICEEYQSGARFSSDKDIRPNVITLCRNTDAEVSMWAFKALVEIGNREDLPHIRSALRDGLGSTELLSWATSAYLKIATEEERESAFREGLFPKDHLALMAFAFAHPSEELPRDLPRVDLDKADSTTLKWACLCMATKRGGEGVFDPKFDQKEQLIALNKHDHPMVSQYSIYAMGRREDVRFKDLGFSFSDIGAKGPKIRRWTYALFGAEVAAVRENTDILNQIISDERSRTAREGFAYSLRNTWYDGLDDTMLGWYDSEREDDVKLAIAEHLAACSDRSNRYQEAAFDLYKNLEELPRAKIKSAAEGTRLFVRIQRFELTRDFQPSLFIEGDLHLQKNTQNFYGDTNIGVNSNSGDISTGAVDQTIEVPEGLLQVVSELLEAAKHEDSREANDFVAAAAGLELNSTKATVNRVLDASKAWMNTLKKGSELALKIGSVIGSLI